MDTDGGSVPNLWQEGRLQEIVDYNEFDALTTHLVWARMAHFAGLLNHEAYELEQALVRILITEGIENGKSHFKRYLAEWDRLQALIAKR